MNSPTPKKDSQSIFQCVIDGKCFVKKNQQKIIRARGRTFAIQSKHYQAWERSALVIMKDAWRSEPIGELMTAEFKFYFENQSREPDVSNLIEGPQDALKKAGVIVDDRLIRRVIGEKFFGEKPRTEIILTMWEKNNGND